MGWAAGLASGLSSGVALGNSIQRNQAMQQEQDWKAEDRQRETDERKQLDELGKVMGTMEQGDFSPAIAKANSSGMFGPDRYAAGARVGEDGLVYANVYDNKDPVNSMQEVKLGKLQDVKNQVFMANAPPSVVAKLALAQAQNQMNPQYQQQMALGAEMLKQKQFESANQPIKFNTDQVQAQANLAHTLASTDNANAAAKQQALMSPVQLRKAEADADQAEFARKNPYWNRVIRKEITDAETGESRIVTNSYGDGQQPAALAGQAPGAAPAQQQAAPAQPVPSHAPTAQAAPTAKTAAPTVDAKTYYQGLVQRGVSRDQAKALTLQKFGSK